jgi:polyisoprenoid-binding protein YceI
MKKALAIVAAVALLSFTIIKATSWKADTVHSNFGFNLKHLGIAAFNGNFKEYTLTITGEAADFSDAVVELSATTASINTGNENRDKHLRSADFFDAEKFPTFTFKSTSFKKASGNTYTVTGDLNLHGVTKPVTLTAEIVGKAVHPQSKKDMVGLKVTGSFKRTDFGIGTGMPTAMLSEDVNIAGDFEFIKN